MRTNHSAVFLLVAVVIGWNGVACVCSADVTSVADYVQDKSLIAPGEKNFECRKRLYGERFSGEIYRGTASQNIKLLEVLQGEEKIQIIVGDHAVVVPKAQTSEAIVKANKLCRMHASGINYLAKHYSPDCEKELQGKAKSLDKALHDFNTCLMAAGIGTVAWGPEGGVATFAICEISERDNVTAAHDAFIAAGQCRLDNKLVELVQKKLQETASQEPAAIVVLFDKMTGACVAVYPQSWLGRWQLDDEKLRMFPDESDRDN